MDQDVYFLDDGMNVIKNDNVGGICEIKPKIFTSALQSALAHLTPFYHSFEQITNKKSRISKCRIFLDHFEVNGAK